MQMLGERGVVAAGILVEQPAHIGLGHGRSDVAGTKARELQPRAVIILRIRVARPLESGDGAGAVAEPIADGAEREPGGGEVRRQLDRLRQDIGGSGEIAARRQVDCRLVAPVGEEVARGDEERAGIGHAVRLPEWRAGFI